jgi:hypothetical protein
MCGVRVGFPTCNENRKACYRLQEPATKHCSETNEFISHSHILLEIHCNSLTYSHLLLGLKSFLVRFSIHVCEELLQFRDPG